MSQLSTPTMKRILLLLLLPMLWTPTSLADRLHPFISDGCSLFPEGTWDHGELWIDCCTSHDLAYWLGGSYAQRLAADRELKVCVEQVGEPEIAAVMLAGVRVGGTPYLPAPFRWGYGWDRIRGYHPLSPEELWQAQTLLDGSLPSP